MTLKDRIRQIAKKHDIRLSKSRKIFIGGMFFDQAGSDIDLLKKLLEITKEDCEIDPAWEKQSRAEDDAILGPYKRYFKQAPFKHQSECLMSMADLVFFYIAHAPGLGKTATVLANASKLFLEKKIDALLVIAPNGVHTQWVDQALGEHVLDEIPVEAFAWDAKKRSTQATVHAARWFFSEKDERKLHVAAINIDSIITKHGAEFCRRVLDSWRCMLVIDEAHDIKNGDAKRTATALEWAPKAEYRRCLSGTPITKDPQDLYTQYLFLDRGFWSRFGFHVFSTFRNYFCVMRQRKPREEEEERRGCPQFFPVAFRNLDKLAKMISPVTHSRRLRDCVDLPPLVYEKRVVAMTPKQQEVYDQFKDEMFVELNGREMTTQHLLTHMLRLSELTGGFITFTERESKPEPLPDGGAKIAELFRLIEELDGKTIIWATRTHEIEMIAAALSKKYGESSVLTYYGATTSDARREAKQAFRSMSGHPAKFFVGNPQAGGTGLDLNGAENMVFYSNSYDAKERWQAKARFERIGQKNSMLLVDIVCAGSVDERVLGVLEKKQNVADAVRPSDAQSL